MEEADTIEPTPCLFLRGKMADLVPCLSIVSVLIVIFGFVAFMRYMNYRETLLLAEKGLTRPEAKNRKGFLRWGIVVTALGLALSLGFYFIGFNSAENYPFHLGPWMLGGFVPLFLGLSLLLIHLLTKKDDVTPKDD
jgi:sterol desaturase/sphingolipid hydroxylase (fatty acid hydroxylase superfamily)